MKDARAVLDSLMQSGGEAVAKARDGWDAQSAGTKGALAGGLLGLLFGGGRGGLGAVARVGGMAAIGSLAAKAFADWQAGQGSAAAADLPPDPRFLPADPAAADDMAARLLKAMVAAAKADGQVSEAERGAIAAQIDALGLGSEAAAMLAAELAAPLDVEAIAGLARTPEEATGLYAASLIVTRAGGPAETEYLRRLAERMKLDPGLVAQLQARLAQAA
jgi:uncharacterized membrane protein YebE (DUF533 family)